MSDIKLFLTKGSGLVELDTSASPLEKSLQTRFEQNLEILLGVRFLASEYATTNGGRMDTLGIDENGYPVIIEYKRSRSENVINQGLFYLDWLMDHRGDFEILVRDRLGKDEAVKIEWSAPRLICIAADFTKYDTHAINQMGRNIELVRYRQFGSDLLLLELLTTVSDIGARSRSSFAPSVPASDTNSESAAVLEAFPVYEAVPLRRVKTVTMSIEDADEDLSLLISELEEYLFELGDDVTRKVLDNYLAFRRIKNFACVEVRPTIGVARVYLKINPDTLELDEGFTRDVRQVGHYGTGDLEVTIKTPEDLERAKPLIIQSYEAS